MGKMSLRIGKNILIALLHTFHHDKYGVWNNRTESASKTIKRLPITALDTGINCSAINEKLTRLAAEHNTDLTAIDGFMWFVSEE